MSAWHALGCSRSEIVRDAMRGYLAQRLMTQAPSGQSSASTERPRNRFYPSSLPTGTNTSHAPVISIGYTALYADSKGARRRAENTV